MKDEGYLRDYVAEGLGDNSPILLVMRLPGGYTTDIKHEAVI